MGLSHAAGLQHGREAHQSSSSLRKCTLHTEYRGTARFVTHPPATLEINHRPWASWLPGALLTRAVDTCPGTLAPPTDSRESRWRVLA